MYRTLPALIALTLAACSGGSSSSSTTGAGSGPGGSVSGGATSGTASSSGSGGATGSANGGSANNGSSTGNQGTSSGGNGGTVTVNNFNTLLNQVDCKFIYSCDDSFYAPYLLDALCQTMQPVDFKDLPAAVDAGRVRFDPVEAATCINAIGSAVSSGNCAAAQIVLSCAPFVGPDDALVQPAGACYSSLDCISGSCTGNDTSTCTSGTCAGLVASGSPCDCTNCGVCDPDGGLTCVSNSCTPVVGAGQPCSRDSDCKAGLVCPDATCSSLPIGAGNECTQGTGECASGLYCFQKSGSFGNCATQLAAGQPCGEDAAHQTNAFSEIDSECAGPHPVCVGAGTLTDGGIATGTCAQFSDEGGSCKAPGAAIGGGEYNDGCYGGLNCVSGACVKPPSTGKDCSATGIPCDPTQSYCAGATGKCAAFIAPGGTCTGTDEGECGLTAVCNSNNICQTPPPPCSPAM